MYYSRGKYIHPSHYDVSPIVRYINSFADANKFGITQNGNLVRCDDGLLADVYITRTTPGIVYTPVASTIHVDTYESHYSSKNKLRNKSKNKPKNKSKFQNKFENTANDKSGHKFKNKVSSKSKNKRYNTKDKRSPRQQYHRGCNMMSKTQFTPNMSYCSDTWKCWQCHKSFDVYLGYIFDNDDTVLISEDNSKVPFDILSSLGVDGNSTPSISLCSTVSICDVYGQDYICRKCRLGITTSRSSSFSFMPECLSGRYDDLDQDEYDDDSDYDSYQCYNCGDYGCYMCTPEYFWW